MDDVASSSATATTVTDGAGEALGLRRAVRFADCLRGTTFFRRRRSDHNIAHCASSLIANTSRVKTGSVTNSCIKSDCTTANAHTVHSSSVNAADSSKQTTIVNAPSVTMNTAVMVDN